jgi:hypothetical protein
MRSIGRETTFVMHLLQSPYNNIVASSSQCPGAVKKLNPPVFPYFTGGNDPTRKIQFFSEYVSPTPSSLLGKEGSGEIFFF